MSRIGALFLLILALTGCGKPPMPLAAPEPPMVTVEHPQERLLDSYTEFTGYLKSTETLEVRAQVTGYLKEIKFTDGAIVHEGDDLYMIDPVPYQAALDNADGNLQKVKADLVNQEAQLNNARLELTRAAELLKSNSIAKEDFDKRKTTVDTVTASVNSAKAAIGVATADLDKAKFDRKNCTIKCEVKGMSRISRTNITVGNLVQSGQTILARVTSLDPIYAYWDVDEMTSLKYRRMIYDTKEIPDPRKPTTQLKCWIGLKDDKGYPLAGKVDYIGPEIVRGTGTREVRGVFDNRDFRLGPGDSVRVKVEAGPPKKYITVPEVAIGSQQRQKFVYVVATNEKGKPVAEFRPVVLGVVREIDGVRIQLIESGLSPQDRVIVNGMIRVRPGAEINPQAQQPLAKPGKS